MNLDFSPQEEAFRGEVRDWPWTTLEPADFTLPADPNALPAGAR